MTDKQALREVAEKAISEEGVTWWSEDQLASDYGLALHKADAKFIAAANPVTVLALLDELETKEEQRANWFQMAQKLGEDLDAAEKRIAELTGQLTGLFERVSGENVLAYPDGAINWLADTIEGELDASEGALKNALRRIAELESNPIATLDVQSGRADGNKFALVYSSAAHKLPDDVYYLCVAAAGIGKGE